MSKSVKLTAVQQAALDKLKVLGRPATSQEIGVQIKSMQTLKTLGLVRNVAAPGADEKSGRECESVYWDLADVFKEVNEFAKELQFEVEHAWGVNEAEMVVTPGIHILHNDADAPLFLSVDELRRLADEALKRTTEMMERD